MLSMLYRTVSLTCLVVLALFICVFLLGAVIYINYAIWYFVITGKKLRKDKNN